MKPYIKKTAKSVIHSAIILQEAFNTMNTLINLQNPNKDIFWGVETEVSLFDTLFHLANVDEANADLEIDAHFDLWHDISQNSKMTLEAKAKAIYKSFKRL